MKKKDLEMLLKRNGWQMKRQGGSHEVWEKNGKREMLPRHREIAEQLAKAIIRRQGLK